MREEQGNLILRDAEESEFAQLRAITLAAYQEYAAELPRPVFEEYQSRLLQTLADPGKFERIVVVREGMLVGCVLLFPPQTSAASASASAFAGAQWPELRQLAVLPAARGQGIAAALLNECEKRARLSGATRLGLHTLDMMQVAIPMYERRGFRRTPELDIFPAPGVHVKGYLLDLKV